MGQNIRELLAQATESLSRAGVSTPRVDAEVLAAHLLDIPRTRLAFAEPTPGFAARFGDLVAARGRRIPLQHLIGTAAFGPVTLQVGPGVFVPRPETEVLLEWATRYLTPTTTAVDLCTGSGALAVALAHAQPSARVIGVELGEAALSYARRNARGSAAVLLRADVTDPDMLAQLNGAVDLMVANPPYIPDDSELEPEVAQYDPPEALFGGRDGLDVIRSVILAAGRLLRPGGLVGVEHDDSHGGRVGELFTATGLFDDVAQLPDLTGRPRFVTARRKLD